MKEITIGMKFKNRSNGRIAEVARIDEVGAAADLMYLEVADGQSKGGRASLANLRGQKSWSFVHDEVMETTEVVEQPEDVSRETIQEAPAEEKSNTLADIMSPAVDIINRAEAQEEAEKAEKRKKKADKPKKMKRVEENLIDPISIVIDFLKTSDVKHKYNGGKYVGIYSDSGKTANALVYRRKRAIRLYINDDLFDTFRADNSLYVQKGPGTKKFDYSIYVNTENVNAVFDKMFKEV